MEWRQFTRDVKPTDFDTVYRALAQLFEVAADESSPGISDSKTHRGSISLATNLAEGFFAGRLHEADRVVEAFLITPSQAHPRLGLAIFGNPGEVPRPLQTWLGPDDRCEALPSFTALATLLASDGRASVADRTSEAAEAEIEYLKQLLADQGDDLRKTKARFRAKQDALLKDGESDGGDFATTWELDELADWCAQNDDRIVVLPRARTGAKKSRYEDPSLIFTALELLAGPYRDLRRGQIDQKLFSELLLPSGLRLEGSVSPSVAGEQGDAYFVNWGNRRHFMGLHLLKGGGREERFCFRLYFFWDSASQRPIVGSMPAHLENSLS